MAKDIAFEFPPISGNTEADVIYYAIFLVIQIGVACWYCRAWNWPIFLGLFTFLIFEVLGSVAYLKLHFTPVTGGWYTLWLFALTAGPTFFISTLHLCVRKALFEPSFATTARHFPHPTSQEYFATCLAIDTLTIVFAVIGSVFVGAKAPDSPLASYNPGFDVMVAGMAVQLCSLVALAVAGWEAISTLQRQQRKGDIIATESNAGSVTVKISRRFRFPMVFRIAILFNGILLFARTIVRAVALSGGVGGPIQGYVLVNVETILLFVAILLVTVIHPAINLSAPKR